MKERKQLAKICAYCLLSASFVGGVFVSPAQAATPSSTTVIVDANRQQELANTNAQSETIITKQDIQRQKAQSLEDIIFQQTSIGRTVNSRGGVGISIRGADPRHTLMLVDGEPLVYGLSKFNGDTDETQRIGTNNIQSVDIIRGASSAEYGADAIGGVVNIITQPPTEKPSMTLDMEWTKPSDGSTLATNTVFDERDIGKRFGSNKEITKNFAMHVNTGRLGKVKSSFFYNNRQIPKIFADKGFAPPPTERYWHNGDSRSTLRFFGNERAWGGRAVVDLNANNQISFNISRNQENVKKYDKYTDGLLVPDMTSYRNRVRDTISFKYDGKNDKTNWSVKYTKGHLKSNTISTMHMAFMPSQSYSGGDILMGLDQLDQTRQSFTAKVNHSINDKHTLTVGLDVQRDSGTGNRIALADDTHVESILPDDYVKTLWHGSIKPGETVKQGASFIHDKLYVHNPDGSITWDVDGEIYGPNFHFTKERGVLTKDDFDDPKNVVETHSISKPTADNPHPNDEKVVPSSNDMTYSADQYINYYKYGKYLGDFLDMFAAQAFVAPGDFNAASDYAASHYIWVTVNGKSFGEDYVARNNKIRVGKANLNKWGIYLADDYQMSPNTLLHTVLRLDKSDKFKSNLSYNIGLTHNLGGDPHTRLKMNAGTGYATPGMGELYYLWEMFPGAPGWFWVGNPNLKPEHSKDMSITLEGERSHSYLRATLFHNHITDYMTYFYTGRMLNSSDGARQLALSDSQADKFSNLFAATVPEMKDRIYSFKNLGDVRITGLELEWKQKLGNYWQTSLGYTYLNINNRDWQKNGLPKQLLDRPKHKLDISLSYNNPNNGWSGSIWGDYYIHFLDGNAPYIREEGLLPEDFLNQNIVYPMVTYGIWNGIIQKQINPSLQVYFGVNNLFNHRYDPQALPERTYRVGMHMKLDDAVSELGGFLNFTAYRPLQYKGNWFLDGNLSTPLLNSTETKALAPGETKVSFTTRNTYDNFENIKTIQMKERTKYMVGDADSNVLNPKYRGFQFYNTLRVDAGLDNQVNVHAEASLGATPNVKTKDKMHKGLALNELSIDRKTNNLSWGIGRLKTKLGPTGYLFGQSFTGAEASVKTGAEKQGSLTVGVGSFSYATGIQDSAYNHWTPAHWSRKAKASEIIGMSGDINVGGGASVNHPHAVEVKGQHVGYAQQYEEAQKLDKKEGGTTHRLAVLKDFFNTFIRTPGLGQARGARIYDFGRHVTLELFFGRPDSSEEGIITTETVYPVDIIPNDPTADDIYVSGFRWVKEKFAASGAVGNVISMMKVNSLLPYDSDTYKMRPFKNLITGELFTDKETAIKKTEALVLNDNFWDDFLHGGPESRGVKIPKVGLFGHKNYKDFVNAQGVHKFEDMVPDTSSDGLDTFANNYLTGTGGAASGAYADFWANNKPLDVTNAYVDVDGFKLDVDKTPAMNKGLFINWQQQMNKRLGLQAFTWQSVGDKAERLANIWGIGASYQIAPSAVLTLETGVNHSDFAKMRHNGSSAAYGIASLRVGRLDPSVAKTWSAYMDYKFFQRGSYLGGTGSTIVPDRYLDGVRSWTTGVSFVPFKNFVFDLYYTFNAEGTQRRIGFLNANETFKLDNMMRIQATYHF